MCLLSGPKYVLVRKEHTGLDFVFTLLWSTGILYFAVVGLQFDIAGLQNMHAMNLKIVKKGTPDLDYKLQRVTECL